MTKFILYFLIFLQIVSINCYAAENFEFGPAAFMSEGSSIVMLPTDDDTENLAICVDSSYIKYKQRKDYNYLSFDLYMDDFADANFYIADTMMREMLLFSFSSDGSVMSPFGIETAGYSAGNWINIIVSYDYSNGLYIYFDGVLFVSLSDVGALKGIYGLALKNTTAYFDNINLSNISKPQILKTETLEYDNGLKSVKLYFDAPVVAYGKVTDSLIYSFPSPVNVGNSQDIMPYDVYDIWQNELNVQTSVTVSEKLGICIIGKVVSKGRNHVMEVTFYNPDEEALKSDIFIAVYKGGTLEDIVSYSSVEVNKNVESCSFDIDTSAYGDDINIRLFVWKRNIVPYKTEAYIGDFGRSLSK